MNLYENYILLRASSQWCTLYERSLVIQISGDFDRSFESMRFVACCAHHLLTKKKSEITLDAMT